MGGWINESIHRLVDEWMELTNCSDRGKRIARWLWYGHKRKREHIDRIDGERERANHIRGTSDVSDAEQCPIMINFVGEVEIEEVEAGVWIYYYMYMYTSRDSPCRRQK